MKDSKLKDLQKNREPLARRVLEENGVVYVPTKSKAHEWNN